MELMIVNGKKKEIEGLLKNYKYRDVHGDLSWTPLHVAVFMREIEIAKILLQAGADKGRKTTKTWRHILKGFTPRDIAEIFNLKEFLKIL